MTKPDISYNWGERNDLLGRLAALAEETGPSLPRDAFTGNTEFMRAWRQDTDPDVILAPLLFALGVNVSDDSMPPLDTFLHEERKRYDQQQSEVDEIEASEQAFIAAGILSPNSSFVRAFAQYRERIEDLRGHFFDIPLDRAEAFADFVIFQVLERPEEIPYHDSGSST